MKSLSSELVADGMSKPQADLLEQAFGQEVDFIAGMAAVILLLARDDTPDCAPPRARPWREIWDEILKSPDKKRDVFLSQIALLPTDIRDTLDQVVTQKVINDQAYLAMLKNNAHGKSPEHYVNILANLGYRFRKNECLQVIEVNGKPISDDLAAEIRAKARNAGVKDLPALVDAYTAYAYKNRYHPIRRYLEKLRPDGNDHITELASFVKDEENVFYDYLRRWLIGACARAYQPVRNRVFVFDGAQNLGKSRFVYWLANPMIEYFQEGPIIPDNKDHRLLLLKKWIWEVSEWGTVARRADREALKAFITTQTIDERAAYDKYNTTGQAITSFIATANNEMGLFNDPTGSSRFMTAKITAIDWKGYTRHVDVDQVWAQAYQLYINGELSELSDAEREKASEINEKYQMLDIVEETILRLYEIGDKRHWVSSLDILDTLKSEGGLKAGIEIDPRKMASALTKLGLDKPIQRSIAGRPVRGYFGIRKLP